MQLLTQMTLNLLYYYLVRCMEQKNIRNFSIIAHIDHGKSTLADRIMELTGAVQKREMQDQLLDNMDIERERGITIKLNAVELKYHYHNEDFIFHLIDTPGHVDFTYEVSRSLAACEGVILVVDAAQGIEAQTLANLYLAIGYDLKVIPIVNKIDLPNANPEKVANELVELGFNKDEILYTSAKTGLGVDKLLDAIVERIPAPNGNPNGKLKALIFDSKYDSYQGVVAYIRVVDGTLKVGDKIRFMSTKGTYEVVELGVHNPKTEKRDSLYTGEVGYVSAAIKSISDVKVGDTITLDDDPATEPLPGYKPMKPMVFTGLYPVVSSNYPALRDALEKLKLNDASLSFEPETSQALGFGFRCGFLGLLHMDIIEERLEREFNLDLIATSPSVKYEIVLTDGTEELIDSPVKMPDRTKIKSISEPYIRTNILVPSDYIGPVMQICQDKRGEFVNMEYLNSSRVNVHYDLPLSEIVYDFFDKLKSSTKGYASFDYELIGYRESDLVKLNILLNGEVVDAFSTIVYRGFAYDRGKAIVNNLAHLIPRQQFEVPVQAAIGTKMIARADIKAVRKDVLAKCYGGDVSRKRKLLEKQKEGKKRMKTVGHVEIPQEAFLAVLKSESDE
jgi:GTP-binding protein LepA